MQKYQDFFNGIKEIITKINGYSQPKKYDDKYMKIKFNTDDNIILNKIMYFPTITIIIRSVTQKEGQYYPQLFLDDCLYEECLYANVCMLEYDKIDISEGIDIGKANKSRECDICHYWYFLDKSFNYEKRFM